MSTVKLADVAIESRESLKEKDNSLPVVGLEHIIPEQINLTEWDIGVENTFTKTFQKGDVLFGRRRAYLKKAAVAPCEGICSGDITVIRAKEDKIIPELLPFIIQNDEFFDYAVGKSAGSLSPRVKWEHLANYEFNLPTIEEQKKLAATLWQIVATMESYKNLLAKTDEMVKAKFVEMFGKIQTDTKGWGITTLDNCCRINPTKPKEINKELNYSFVPMTMVSENGHINTTTEKRYSEVCKGFTYFAENDVLFAKITPCMENGKGCVATGLINGIGFGSTEFHVLRPIENVSNPYWLYIITMFDDFRKQAEKNMTGTGGQKRVPASFLQNFEIALPPIELQNQFAEIVKNAGESKSGIQSSLDSLTKVYKKIISDNMCHRD